MPRESFINHPKRSPFITIRKHYVDIADSDYCLAALLGTFEWWTANKMENNDLAGRPEEAPWIEASIPEIHTSLVGLYSQRSIQSAINTLVNSKVLDKKVVSGSTNQYLLDRDLLQDFIDSKRVIDTTAKLLGDPSKNDTEIAVPPLAKTTDPSLLYKDFKTEEEGNTNPPIGSQDVEDLDVEDAVEIFVKNVYSRSKTSPRPQLDNLRSKDGQQIVESLRQAEANVGAVEFRSGLLDYLETSSDWNRENRWPIRGYLKRCDTSKNVSSLPRKNSPSAPPSERRMPSTPPVSAAPTVLGMPSVAVAWNTTVPAGAPVEIWTRELQQTVDMCCQTKDFLEEWIPKLFSKCRVLCAAEKGKFITFEWALKNWTRVINGGCDWVLSRDGPAAKPKYETAADRKRRAREEAQREADEDVRKSKENPDGKHT